MDVGVSALLPMKDVIPGRRTLLFNRVLMRSCYGKGQNCRR